jgi:hypothetical protein
MIRLVAAAAVTCLISCAAIARDTPSADQAQPVKEKKVCRTVVPTGTIMGERICLTRTEWARLNAENEKHANMMTDNRTRALDTRTMGDALP